MSGAATSAANIAEVDASVGDKKKVEEPIVGGSSPSLMQKPEDQKKEDKKSKLIAAEEKEEGSVKSSVYKSYISAIGGMLIALLILASFILEYANRMISDWWLSYWSNKSSEGDTNTGFYLGIYGTLGFTFCTAHQPLILRVQFY